jgi:hypothetical protein
MKDSVLQVPKRSTLHQISKPEGFASPEKAPPPTATRREIATSVEP